MTKKTAGLADPQMRAQVIRELSAAMDRLGLDMPHADAGLILKMGIGFFAGAHAEHFGHAETARILIKTARLGISLAQSEFPAEPDPRETVSH
jgi:hypothetical protein